MSKKKESALKVNKGIETPSQVNPYLQEHFPKTLSELSAEAYCDAIRNGDISLLSRAITLTESNLDKHRNIASEILATCLSSSGNSIRIGITGTPGVGKSTFIEAFGLHLLEQGHRIAVLAIDPSSQKTGGSILGDKTRMEVLSGHPDVFIRPSASAGILGGVARKTKESILLCEAAGFDIIMVETVGVGQSEMLVKNMIDFFLLLLLPGAGDELQGIKRGIMEVADAIVINKADGQNLDKANMAKNHIQNALQLFPPNENHWKVPVLMTSALHNKGIKEVGNMILNFEKKMKKNGFFVNNRLQQEKFLFFETLKNQILEHFYSKKKVKKLLPELEKKIQNGEMSSFAAVEELFRNIKI
jgi:LAO/AO transport system kinase